MKEAVLSFIDFLHKIMCGPTPVGVVIQYEPVSDMITVTAINQRRTRRQRYFLYEITRLNEKETEQLIEIAKNDLLLRMKNGIEEDG